MSDIIFKKAIVADASILADMRTNFIIDFAGPQPESDVQKLKVALTNYFQKSIDENNCISYLAECDNKTVATGTIVFREQPGHFRNPSGRVGYVMNMYTIPHYRRRGICTSILELLIADARSLGISAFELHATEEGEPVYVKNGFLKHGEPTYRKYFSSQKHT